jgi:nicotinamidase/pyrazinamidase
MLDRYSALIVVDVQNDFCPEGGLPVAEGDKVVPIINKLMDSFQTVVATQDWHPANHSSFSSNNSGTAVYDMKDIEGIPQVMWPDHCVHGTDGADFHKDLNTDKFSVVIRKGTQTMLDSYSGFLENDKKTPTGLKGYLTDKGINKVYVTGLATDYCVMYTAMDAKAAGFDVYLISDACRGVDFPAGNVDAAIKQMQENGIHIITSGGIR